MSRASMQLQVPEFEIVDPVSTITKMGMGADLYTIDASQGDLRLVPVGYLPMNDVVEIQKAGGKFLEVKRG